MNGILMSCILVSSLWELRVFSSFDDWFEELKESASYYGFYIDNAADWEDYYKMGMMPDAAWKKYGNK
ncbi:hypothetical protein FKOIJHOC_00110 [Acinetobacter phage Ab_121]|nr:hypothetical protein FKOIJHOC_00110 [Acinetobacter phage Ab_121]